VAVNAIQRRYEELKQKGWKRTSVAKLPNCEELLQKICQLVPHSNPTPDDLMAFKKCFKSNHKLMNENLL
jgi:hypothetical protein